MKIVTLFSACVLSTAASAQDWPRYLGPHEDGTSTETGLLHAFPEGGPKVLWSKDVGPGFGGVAVRDGEVYLHDRLTGEADVLRVFDLETGEEEWTLSTEAPGRLMFAGSRCVPTVTEEEVYLLGGFGQVQCVDRELHELVWNVELMTDYDAENPGYGFCQAPLVVGDLVVVAAMTEDVGLVALDRFTGEEVWSSPGLGSSHSTPLLFTFGGVEQILFLSSKVRVTDRGLPFVAPQDSSGGLGGLPPVDSFLTSFSPEGDQLWQTSIFTAPYPITVPVKVDEHRLFMTNGYQAGSALLELHEQGGETAVTQVFHHSRGSQIHVPILVDDHFYVLANENQNDMLRLRKEGGLMCLDLDGNEKWRTGDKPYFGRGSMILADGMLIIQDGYNGTLRLVEPTPEEYRPLAEANLFGVDDRRDHQMWAPLALAGGHLFLRSQERLLCVDLRAGS